MTRHRRQRLRRGHLHDADDEDPIDAAIDRRHPHRALRRQLLATTKELEGALGDRRDLWLKLEELLNELHGTREGEYFALGLEQGFATGRADAHRRSPRTRQLAARLRDIAIQSGPRREEALAALLEATWSLVVSKPDPRE